MTGPATGAPYTVWKWAASPINEATRLTVAPDQHGVPQRVAYWDRKSGTYDKYTLSTPEGWAEVLYKNATYNCGFASFGADIYLRLPGDRDPNTLYVTPFTAPNGSSKGRIVVSAPDVRVSGFEIRTVDLWFTATASRGVVDHNLFFGSSLTYRGESGPPATYSTDQLVERNRFVDTGLWSVEPANPTIPWNFIKNAIFINGKSTDWSRVGAEAETTAIGARGGARQTVIRYNTIDGFFNGVGIYNEGFDRYSQADTDIHDNLLRQISDDSFEPEQQAINWRIWNNRLEEVRRPSRPARSPTARSTSSATRSGGWAVAASARTDAATKAWGSSPSSSLGRVSQPRGSTSSTTPSGPISPARMVAINTPVAARRASGSTSATTSSA